MSFTGSDPYGTPGGFDSYDTPFDPVDVRLAEGRNYIFFLIVNGPVTEKNRENVEDVIRVLGLRGQDLAGVIIRDNGTVIDPAATDLNFEEGLAITLVAPGVVRVDIPPSGLTTTLFADGSVTAVKLDSTTVTEFVQDVVGITFVDTPSIDFTYNDAAGQMSAVVLYGGSGGDFGAANTVARSDHKHTATLTQRTGTHPGGCLTGNFCSIGCTCNAGETLVAGGCGGGGVNIFMTDCKPTSATSWIHTFFNSSGGTTGSQTATCMCQEAPIA